MNFFGVGQPTVEKSGSTLDGRLSDDRYKIYRTNEYTYNSSKMADRFCQVGGRTILMIDFFHFDHDTGTTYVHGKRLQGIDSVYTVPCPSTYVDIITVQIRDEAPDYSTNVSAITGKYFCMPIDLKTRQYALSKLLHCKIIVEIYS
jgi:hypothetical protein